MLRKTLSRVVAGEDLTKEEARDALAVIMHGEATPAQIAAFLVALRMKGETVDEIVGCAEAMRAAATRVELERDDLVDTCGTGGDGAGTFNVSTAAALVAAGAGARVAKHGNRAVSSACGSADVLEALGLDLEADPHTLRRCMDEAGIVFLFAPALHPAMKHAIGPRRELGLRSVFNVLGPLTNPAGARRQVLGVYDPRLVRTLAEVLGELGADRALVVHGAGGLDEISTLGPTRVAEWDGDRVREYVVEPGDLGLSPATAADLRGGDAEENAKIVGAILGGQTGAPRDVVAANAGAAIYAAGLSADVADGVRAAERSIETGAARAVLERLVETTQEGAARRDAPAEEEQ